MAVVKKLKGKKISLGPISKKYIPTLAKWMNDLEVVKYTDQAHKKHTEETSKIYLEACLNELGTHYYGIFTKKEKLIGGIDLREISYTQRSALLGIAIGEKQYWGKGYGTEAVTLLLDYAFNILNLNNIMLTVFEFNKRAINCYKKAGFKVIGKRRNSRFFAGKYYDEIYMDILAKDFKKSSIRELIK